MIWLALGISVGIALWLAGFWAGSMLTRAMREVVEREVPKIVVTEKVVMAEKPVVLQVPTAVKRVEPSQGPSLPVMGSTRHVIADPNERAQIERIQHLAATEPEAG